MYHIIFFSIFLITTLSVQAQYKVSGRIVDSYEQAPLIGATVIVSEQQDSTRFTGGVADVDGLFNITNVSAGVKVLKAEYAGYKTFTTLITIVDTSYQIGTIRLSTDALTLDTVVIKGKQQLAQIRGDTTEFKASGFKTNRDASAQDLLTKMPGITVENGAVKAQGENVNRVMLDGKEFFGEDANIALRNLPADMIDRTQVYDRGSDQSMFSGFDDGNTQKTLNIITKPGMNVGQFGRVFGGYGTDARYNAGGNLNLFDGNQRITLLGLANNINQQNFSSQDLTGLPGGGNQGRQGSGRGGYGGQGGGNNFNVNQQGGINTTQSGGINYSDNWGKKTTISSSYFFNRSRNFNRNFRTREYLLTDFRQIYNEGTDAASQSLNHRFTARLEFKPDSMNSILFTPRISFQNNSNGSSLQANNRIADSTLLSTTENRTNQTSNAYNLSGGLLYRHRFAKPGRTISTELNTDNNNRDAGTNLLSDNDFLNGRDSSSTINQQTTNANNGYGLGSNITYTEPLSSKSMIQLNYIPSLNKNKSDKITRAYNEDTESYTLINPRLSSTFNNTVITQRAGGAYRLRGEKFNFLAGLNYQNVDLQGVQSYPRNYLVRKNFNSLLPNAMLQYRFSKTQNLRVFYRTSTAVPSVTQLQDVIDNTNPLQLTSGNPNLSQEYNHNMFSRYSSTRASAGSNFSMFVRFALTRNYIGNSILLAARDTTLQDGIVLRRGSQFIRPVNLQGYVSANSFANYSLPISKLKSNLNLNTGIGFTRTPGLINEQMSFSNNTNFNAGVSLASNISEKIDFNISYSGYYNIIKYNIQQESNNNYFNHTASVRLNWNIWKGLMLYSELTNTLYSGLGEAFDRSFTLWNPGLGYRFSTNSELRLAAFDILKQNNSRSVNVTANYVEENRTTVLQRYFMVSYIHSFRNFKNSAKVNTAP